VLYHPFSCGNIDISEINVAMTSAGVYQHNIIDSYIIATEVIGDYAISPWSINNYRLANKFVKRLHVYAITLLQKVPWRIYMGSSVGAKRNFGDINFIVFNCRTRFEFWMGISRIDLHILAYWTS
jgi:hypothetical protein